MTRRGGLLQTVTGLVGGARGRATDAGFAAAWAGVRALPEPVATRLFTLAADRAVARDGAGVRQLRLNLRRVLGPAATRAELDDVVARSMRHYARYWMETFRLPSMRTLGVLERTGTQGAEHIDAAMSRGRGTILALPHMGNWEVAGIWLIDHGVGFTTVAERLKPEALFDRFVAYREGLGFEVLPLTGGVQSASDVLSARLRQGRCVCLLGDRDLSAKGIEISFFDEPARMPPGPALLAATTGATLLPVSLWYDGRRFCQRIGAPVEIPTEGRLRDRVAAATQSLADVFASEIAAHPSDWHMLQRLWTADFAAAVDESSTEARSRDERSREEPV